MSIIQLKITGVAAELSLGNYMPKDTTIFNNWEEFYHFNDLIHVSQLLTDYISEIEIKQDDVIIYKAKIPKNQLKMQPSFSPVLKQKSIYLRTECAEQAEYYCEFESDSFDISHLFFESQDYDLLFKVGNSFLSTIRYDGIELNLRWVNAKPLGNICLLCRYENGFLVPIFDAIKKTSAIN